MKETELMVRDWVELRTNVESIFYKIHNGRDIWANHEDFYPIPLTKEMMKENATNVNNSSYSERTFYIFSQGFVRITIYGVKDGFYFNFNEVIIPITYVHELQHALRFCGLNELADNFKIE